MTKLHKNVKLFAGTTETAPLLLIVVNKLIAHNQNLQFEGFTSYDNVTTGFIIFDGVDQVATIEYGNHMGKANANGDCDPAFAIGSSKVQKERGVRNKQITTDIGAAVRLTKKLMAKPDTNKIVSDLVHTIFNKIDRLADRAESSVRHAINLDYNGMALMIGGILRETEGGLVGAEQVTVQDMIDANVMRIENDIVTKYEINRKFSKIRLDCFNAVHTGIGAFVTRLRGDGVRVAETTTQWEGQVPDGCNVIARMIVSHSPPKGAVSQSSNALSVAAKVSDYMTLDSAPDWVQEKIATLTIAEADYAIPNIGIKVQSDKNVDLFFIYRKQFVENESHEV